MIILTSADTLSLATSAATTVHVVVSYVDTTAAATAGGRQETTIAALASTTIVSAPGAGVERVIKEISIVALGGALSVTVRFNARDKTPGIALLSDEALYYTDTEGWRRMSAAGKIYFDVPVAAGASTPSGTGFRHITAGAEDAAAKLVDTADINANQVTFAKLQQGTTNTIPVNGTAGTADFALLSVGANTVVGRAAGNIVAATLVNAQMANMTGNTFKGEATGGANPPTDIPISAQSVLGRAAGNIVNLAAAAGQSFRRSIAGGDLGFSATEERALGNPIVANAAATNATTNLSCTGSQTIPAGSTIAGSTFTLRGWFSLLHTALPPTLTAEILINGAVVATAVMTVSTTATTHSGGVDGVVTIRTTGAGGTAMAQVNFDTNFSIANSVDGSVGTVTFAIDTTVARTIELRMRQTTAGPATTTLTVTNGFIQRIS